MQRKLVVYIAMSVDGYIAKEDGNIDFLSKVELPGEDYGYAEFQQGVDTLIWGRKTFDKVLTFGIGIPHADKQVYVVSRTLTGTREHVQFHPDVVALVQELKSSEGKDIYCDGGGEIVLALLQAKLVDRLIVSVIPHLLGNGVRLFGDGRPEQSLQYKRSISYPTGLVQLWYDVVAQDT